MMAGSGGGGGAPLLRRRRDATSGRHGGASGGAGGQTPGGRPWPGGGLTSGTAGARSVDTRRRRRVGGAPYWGGGAEGAAAVACVRRGAAVGLLGASSGTGRPAVPAGAVVPERRYRRYIPHRRLWHTRRRGGVVNRVAGMVRVTTVTTKTMPAGQEGGRRPSMERRQVPQARGTNTGRSGDLSRRLGQT